MDFIASVKDMCLREKLFARGDRILIGISGGPDSVALTYALYALRHEWGLQLFLAHLNHGLRPQAKAEQHYVKALASELKLPLFTKTINLATTKSSIEEKAREARLAFLVDTAKKIHAQAIALGHHQDDLAETILMRLLRGTGPMGIRSILPRRMINGINFLRPLLSTDRIKIISFLDKQNIKFCTDASNADTKFLRNKIRCDLLPMIQKKYNPNIKESLVHFSQSVTLIYDHINSEAKITLAKMLGNRRNILPMTLDIKKLSTLSPALLHEVLRLAINSMLGHTRQLTYEHINALELLIKHQPQNTVVSLPHALEVQKTNNSIVIRHKKRHLIKRKKKL